MDLLPKLHAGDFLFLHAQFTSIFLSCLIAVVKLTKRLLYPHTKERAAQDGLPRMGSQGTWEENSRLGA